MKQILSISDSIEGTEYDIKSKVRTFKKYGVEPFVCVGEYVDSEGNSERIDISESLKFCFESGTADAIAIGLLRNPEDIAIVSRMLEESEHNVVIAQPTLIDDKGDVLVSNEAYEAVTDKLLQHVQFMAVNMLEAELFSGMEIKDKDMCREAAAKIFEKFNCLVFIKGTAVTDNEDLLFAGAATEWMEPIGQPFSESTERSFLSSVACELASDKSIIEAVECARRFYVGADQNPVIKPAVNEDLDFPSVEHEEPEAKEELPKLEPTPSLISPAKSLRDIAHQLDAQPAKEEPSKTVTSAIGNPAPKGTVSEIKQPEPKKVRQPEESISELQSLREKLKKISEM